MSKYNRDGTDADRIGRSAIHRASWIWLPQDDPEPHQYVCFRKVFAWRLQDCEAVLEIAADSDYVAYLNGNKVARGQFSDYPQDKTFSHVEVGRHLRQGDNVLSILAYYRGENFSDYRQGKPGLIAALAADGCCVITDESWRVRRDPCFEAGPMPRVTRQMGFVTCYDARLESDWLAVEYDDCFWLHADARGASINDDWQSLTLRPLPPLEVLSPKSVALIMQGSFLRTVENDTVAETMMCDALITQRPNAVFENPEFKPDSVYQGAPRAFLMRLNDQCKTSLCMLPPDEGLTGRFCVFDLGAEEVGLLTISISASAGTILDIAYGEHLDDGRVCAHVGERNFADRYICRGGV